MVTGIRGVRVLIGVNNQVFNLRFPELWRLTLTSVIIVSYVLYILTDVLLIIWKAFSDRIPEV